ncbi:type II restriction endonuclease [Isorropodon fossajaponicum symbiont]|uniref:type II restriction endonuclease n=1 Tax=Isorropodon fossajaponicum symbiont TaxID=883811 RepID=UPI001914EAE3|nr:type II restriction endonuclease [Isorropodon fossajaponicum symbiont]
MYDFNDLKTTFQDSIFTWSYFTDFSKVKLNVAKVDVELNILNSLIGKDDIESEFISLIKQYPNIRKALPLLIATRKNKLQDTPIVSDVDELISENKSYIFYNAIDEKIKKELLIFFNESGLKEIFINKHVKNLVDYCFGVEVGFDTNARKGRTGKLMEGIVSQYLQDFCSENNNFSYIEQATQASIKAMFDYEIRIDKNNRRFDFALYNEQNRKLYLIEVNYYGGGSKLKATAGEYQALNDFVKSQGLNFNWITDGRGWLTALNPLEETFNHNDHVINLNMLYLILYLLYIILFTIIKIRL